MKRTLSFLTVMIALAGLGTACGTIQRSSKSGYADRPSELNVRRDRRAYEEKRAAKELGIYNLDRADDDQVEAVETRRLLRKAERYLEGRRERDQYFRNKPYLKNDEECLAFLRLPTYEARQRWLDARGIQGTATANSPAIQSLIDQSDITLGMTKQAVRDAWGEPEAVEVAGNPIYGNERWQYSEQITSSEGYQTERRLVYFESGKVVGWEKH